MPSHTLSIHVKRAATVDETRLLVSVASHKLTNEYTWALVAHDTDRVHGEAAETDYNRLVKSLGKPETPLNKSTISDLEALVKSQQASLAATIEELEVREEIAATEEKLRKAEREVKEDTYRVKIAVEENRKEMSRSQSRLRDAQRKEKDVQRELELKRRRLRRDAEKAVKERKGNASVKEEAEDDNGTRQKF